MEYSKTNPQYFGHIYRRYGGSIFSFFYRRLGSKEVSADLTQETFLRAFRNRQNFIYQGYPYSSYLFRIAKNLLVNYYKKKKTLSLEALEYEPYSKPSFRSDFDNRLVWKALETLSFMERRVLEERYKKGKTIKEISEVVNKSENAVKLILSRARKKLRKHPIVRD